MADAGKRKTAPAGGEGQPTRKKKAGTKGKWQTPHQKAKAAQAQSGQVQAGDVGLWATCARGQESRAARELAALLGEYGESMYGVKQEGDEGAGEEQERRGDEGEKEGVEKEQEEEDIESAIRREVAALKAREKDGDLRHHQPPSGSALSSSALPPSLFKVIRVGNLDCLLFARARVPPVDPVALVRRICADALACADPRRRRSRYLNRLSPVSASGKATEQGLAEVAARALGAVFMMIGTAAVQDGREGQKKEEREKEGQKRGKKEGNDDDGVRERESGEAMAGGTEESCSDIKGAVGTGPDAKAPDIVPPAEQKPYTFAIRPTIRNHGTLKRDAVVKQVASLIDEQRHKVNLGSPDKIILVEIFQATCGISVVDGSDWESLKKFNISELYSPSRPKQPGEGGVAARVDAGAVKKQSTSTAAEEQQAGGGVEGREGEGEGEGGESCNLPS